MIVNRSVSLQCSVEWSYLATFTRAHTIVISRWLVYTNHTRFIHAWRWWWWWRHTLLWHRSRALHLVIHARVLIQTWKYNTQKYNTQKYNTWKYNTQIYNTQNIKILYDQTTEPNSAQLKCNTTFKGNNNATLPFLFEILQLYYTCIAITTHKTNSQKIFFRSKTLYLAHLKTQDCMRAEYVHQIACLNLKTVPKRRHISWQTMYRVSVCDSGSFVHDIVLT